MHQVCYRNSNYTEWRNHKKKNSKRSGNLNYGQRHMTNFNVCRHTSLCLDREQKGDWPRGSMRYTMTQDERRWRREAPAPLCWETRHDGSRVYDCRTDSRAFSLVYIPLGKETLGAYVGGQLGLRVVFVNIFECLELVWWSLRNLWSVSLLESWFWL